MNDTIIKRRGRRLKDDDKRQSVLVKSLLTQSEAKQLQDAADAAGISVSMYIRKIIAMQFIPKKTRRIGMQ